MQQPYASQLRTLSVRASALISDEGVQKLVSTVRYLETLDLSWCGELMHSTAEHLVATYDYIIVRACV